MLGRDGDDWASETVIDDWDAEGWWWKWPSTLGLHFEGVENRIAWFGLGS